MQKHDHEPDRKNEIETSISDGAPAGDDTASDAPERPGEVGGRGGLDPTRYGDWEKAGRCIDF